MKHKTHNNRGFAAFYITILILAIIFAMAISVSILTYNEQKISRNIVKSSQAYYIAEGGAEDALLRIVENLNLPDSYSFPVGAGTVNIEITKTADSRIVKSSGNISNINKKVEVAGTIATAVTFYYGVQVGEGGLTIDANSQILGNIYSNGPITGATNVIIKGDAVSAGPTGSISEISVQRSSPTSTDGNVWTHNITNSTIDGNFSGYNLSLSTVGGNVDADIISDCTIGGNAYFNTSTNCTIGGTPFTPNTPPADQPTEPMPIPESAILDWKQEAEAGGVMTGPVEIDGSGSLGPVKIVGNLRITSNSRLQLTGTLWVTGNIDFDSNSGMDLSPDYYPHSGVAIADGRIIIGSNVVTCGSEGFSDGNCNPPLGNYLIFISTNPSLDPNLPAIRIDSNSNSAILYTNNGLIDIGADVSLKEVTGYAVKIDADSTITYETGLVNILFSAGPAGGGFKPTSWKEVP